MAYTTLTYWKNDHGMHFINAVFHPNEDKVVLKLTSNNCYTISLSDPDLSKKIYDFYHG